MTATETQTPAAIASYLADFERYDREIRERPDRPGVEPVFVQALAPRGDGAFRALGFSHHPAGGVAADQRRPDRSRDVPSLSGAIPTPSRRSRSRPMTSRPPRGWCSSTAGSLPGSRPPRSCLRESSPPVWPRPWRQRPRWWRPGSASSPASRTSRSWPSTRRSSATAPSFTSPGARRRG